MTALQGHVTATYEQLILAFGPPNVGGDGYKTDVEWEVAQDVFIYNWKNGRNYLGEDVTPVELITRWNIGGLSQLAVDFVKRRVHATTPHA